jgi:hypothetical protein
MLELLKLLDKNPNLEFIIKRSDFRKDSNSIEFSIHDNSKKCTSKIYVDADDLFSCYQLGILDETIKKLLSMNTPKNV